jgi:hypothetical protein
MLPKSKPKDKAKKTTKSIVLDVKVREPYCVPMFLFAGREPNENKIEEGSYRVHDFRVDLHDDELAVMLTGVGYPAYFTTTPDKDDLQQIKCALRLAPVVELKRSTGQTSFTMTIPLA